MRPAASGPRHIHAERKRKLVDGARGIGNADHHMFRRANAADDQLEHVLPRFFRDVDAGELGLYESLESRLR